MSCAFGVVACAWEWADATLRVIGTITASARDDNLTIAMWTNDHEHTEHPMSKTASRQIAVIDIRQSVDEVLRQ